MDTRGFYSVPHHTAHTHTPQHTYTPRTQILCHPAIGSRTSLSDQCLFCLCTQCCRASLLARLWNHCRQWRYVKERGVLTLYCCVTTNRLSSSLCTSLFLFSCFGHACNLFIINCGTFTITVNICRLQERQEHQKLKLGASAYYVDFTFAEDYGHNHSNVETADAYQAHDDPVIPEIGAGEEVRTARKGHAPFVNYSG